MFNLLPQHAASQTVLHTRTNICHPWRRRPSKLRVKQSAAPRWLGECDLVPVLDNLSVLKAEKMKVLHANAFA